MPAEHTRPPGEAASVIHDLGYRRYAGPRLGRRYVWRSMVVESARGAYGLGRTGRAKVVPMGCLAALCVPAVVIAVLAGGSGADEPPIAYTTPAFLYPLTFQPLIAVFVAAQAPAVVSRDLRFGVLPLYFARPMRRLDYVSARYAAFTAAIFVLVAVPLTLLLAGALLAGLPVGERLVDYLVSLVQAAVLAALLAGVALVLASASPRRAVGLAAVLTVLLVLAGVQGVVEDLVEQAGATGLAGWSRLLSPFTLVDGLGTYLLGGGHPFPPGPAGPPVFTVVTVLVVAGCWAMLARRYRRLAG